MKERTKENLESNEKKENLEKSIKLDNLINDEVYEKKVKGLKKNDIYIKLLSSKEKSRVNDLIDKMIDREDLEREEEFNENKDDKSDEEIFKNTKQRYEITKCAILVFSITKINGIDFSNEEMGYNDIVNLYDHLRGRNATFTDVIYLQYKRINNEYFNEMIDLETFKKK